MTGAFTQVIDRCQVTIGAFDVHDPALAIERLRALLDPTTLLTLNDRERWRFQSVVAQMLARFATNAGFDSVVELTEELVCVTAAITTYEPWRAVADRCAARMELLARVRPCSSPKAKPNAPLCVREALLFVDRHYADCTLSLRKIAKHLDVTIWHAAHLFKEHVGDSFTLVLRTRRVIEAQHLLFGSSASMKEISARVGFASPNQFSKAFKAICGLTPSEFRERRRTGQ